MTGQPSDPSDILAAETARRAKLSQAAARRARDDRGRFMQPVPMPGWLHPADAISLGPQELVDAWLDDYAQSQEADDAGHDIAIAVVVLIVSAFIVVAFIYAIWRIVTL